jgi:hypothetical protein
VVGLDICFPGRRALVNFMPPPDLPCPPLASRSWAHHPTTVAAMPWLHPTARASTHRALHRSSGSPALPWGGSARRWRSVPPKAEVKPMCPSGYPPRLDPKTLPFYVPPRVPGEFYPAPQPVKPVPAKPKGSRPGWRMAGIERGESARFDHGPDVRPRAETATRPAGLSSSITRDSWRL